MSDYLFPRERRTFEEAFPELENVAIKVAFLRSGGREEKAVTFTKDNFPGHSISCINPVCRNGGLSELTIPRLIKKMIFTNKLELKEHEFCRGGLYTGKKRFNDCGWSFNIEITIQLRADSQS